VSSYLTRQPLLLYDLVTVSEEVPTEYNMFEKVCTTFVCKSVLHNFHSCTVHLDTIKVFYLPTDAQ